jgi:hypothetical protein
MTFKGCHKEGSTGVLFLYDWQVGARALTLLTNDFQTTDQAAYMSKRLGKEIAASLE